MSDFTVADALAQLRALPVVGDPLQRSRRQVQAFDLTLLTTHVPVLSGRVVRDITNVAWTWAAEIAWRPGANEALDKLVQPYAYTPAYIKLDGVLVLTGWLYKVSPRKTAEGTTLVLEGASLTADLVDSTIPTSVWGNQWEPCPSVWNLCKHVLPVMGILPWTDLNESDLPLCTQTFDVVQVGDSETWGELLARLVFQRAMLVTTNAAGNLVLTVAHTASAKWQPLGDWKDYGPWVCAALSEGKPPALSWSADFDGRKRFHAYVALGQDDMGYKVVSADVVDIGCTPTQRRTTFTAPDTAKGNIDEVAAWRRSAALAEALEIKVTVSGWTPPHSSQLWTPNTLVSVQTPSLFIAKPFDFLLRGVEHIYEANGRTAVLDLVPPETFTGEEIVEKWATVAPPPVPYVEGALD